MGYTWIYRKISFKLLQKRNTHGFSASLPWVENVGFAAPKFIYRPIPKKKLRFTRKETIPSGYVNSLLLKMAQSK